MADKIPTNKVWKKWQVMTGKHTLNSGATFKQGQKFITDANMAVFNTDPDKPKYKDLGEVSEKEAVEWAANAGAKNTNDGSTQVPPSQEDVDASQDTLESMTVADLKEVAFDEDIDLGGSHLKADIIKAIRDARTAANNEE